VAVFFKRLKKSKLHWVDARSERGQSRSIGRLHLNPNKKGRGRGPTELHSQIGLSLRERKVGGEKKKNIDSQTRSMRKKGL